MAKPHMTPDMIEYRGDACEEIEVDIEQQVDSHPTRWAALAPSELLLEKAA